MKDYSRIGRKSVELVQIWLREINPLAVSEGLHSRETSRMRELDILTDGGNCLESIHIYLPRYKMKPSNQNRAGLVRGVM